MKPSFASAFSIHDCLRSPAGPLLARIERTVGFACAAQGLDLWKFGPELRIVSRQDGGAIGHPRSELTLAHPSGLEAEMHYAAFPDTTVLEISGRLVNRGKRTIRGVRGPFALAFKLDLSALGTPRVTWVEGGSRTDGCYPPPAYTVHEADLPATGVMHLLGGRESGRSTETEMPYLFLTEPQTSEGFFVALEWPCRWIIGAGFGKSTGRERLLTLYAHPGWTCFDLEPGGSVIVPRVNLGFFRGDSIAGSNALRRHIVRHVRPSVRGASNLPPVFYNSWYELGNNLKMSDLKRRVDVHAELGVESFVVDAGWFTGGFRAGIGNWEKPDPAKFPDGLEALARYVESQGMKFGSWLEIEFAMKNSDWGRRHRRWFHEATGRQNSFYGIRRYEELLLRLEDKSVRASVGDFLEAWVKEHRIQWLRWDFNDGPAAYWDANESENQVGRLHLGYGEGLYALLDDFMARCPQVHIETCAGGGHRMDLGMIRRAHSAWMNDNSTTYHAVRRMQAGLNRVLPGHYGNSCFHWATVAARTDKSVARAMRQNGYEPAILRSRMAGSLGFAENCDLWTPRIRQYLKNEIARYKSVRRFLMEDYYPLFQPCGISEYDGWQFHDPASDEGFCMVFRCESPRDRTEVALRGLSKGQQYALEDLDTGATQTLRGGVSWRVSVPRVNGTRWLRYRAKE